MNQHTHQQLVAFIWNIADECLRDVYTRGKYRDIILPMIVLRRLDILLEPTKSDTLNEHKSLKSVADDTYLDEALRDITGYPFYNISPHTLTSLIKNARNDKDLLKNELMEYLGGFSPNIEEIIECFNLKHHIEELNKNDRLVSVLAKFTSTQINLSPHDTLSPQGHALKGLDNLGMGYVFEELIRRFNEENNEESGEHFTPREVIKLMNHLIFNPIKDDIITSLEIYDPACGSGGMLTESQTFIQKHYDPSHTTSFYLYGQEVSKETYAICASDMLIKSTGARDSADGIKQSSTLASDTFKGKTFDFMLSNPPYGKTWTSEQSYIMDGKDIIDPRFKVLLADYWGEITDQSTAPRTSDGQLLFLMEMIDKMKPIHENSIGSRIASIHNGSSLFTGDAGSGESNCRRHIIESDLLEAIVQLPTNLFYNTGISTYLWLLSNNKPAHRKGKVQLIDASYLYKKMRKNLGDKNCELTDDHIAQITQAHQDFKDLSHTIDQEEGPKGIASKILTNDNLGYYKVAIECPDRRKAQFTPEGIAPLRFHAALQAPMQHLYELYGDEVYKSTGFGEKGELSFLKALPQDLFEDLPKQSKPLTTKQKSQLLDHDFWLKAKAIYDTAKLLLDTLGDQVFDDFNALSDQVSQILKNHGKKTTAKKAILNAISHYDPAAAKVIKTTKTFKPEELDTLLQRYGCKAKDLGDFGLYADAKTPLRFTIYETHSELRDSESIPLTQGIHDYFCQEVKPHKKEAWIDLESVKIGYEVSFNQHFYHHKPLRASSTIAHEIMELNDDLKALMQEVLGK